MTEKSRAFFGVVVAVTAVSCSTADPGDGPAQNESAVIAAPPPPPAATGSVEAAAATSCTTLSVRGLAQQLVDEINCAKPNVLTSLEGVEGIELDDETFPFVQTPLVGPLTEAARAAKTKLTVNSALRTLPQQVLLSQWAARRRCGITLAARPGGSNHEQGLAVDVANHGALRPSLTKRATCASKAAPGRACFVWKGQGDPVHFDFIGDDGVDLDGESIRAFQRLWNRNHPSDQVAESGVFDKGTEARVKASPAAGFEHGAECAKPPPPPASGPAQTAPPDP